MALAVGGRWALKHPAKEEQARKGLGYRRYALSQALYLFVHAWVSSYTPIPHAM
jgi:hypothetical protein